MCAKVKIHMEPLKTCRLPSKLWLEAEQAGKGTRKGFWTAFWTCLFTCLFPGKEKKGFNGVSSVTPWQNSADISNWDFFFPSFSPSDFCSTSGTAQEPLSVGGGGGMSPLQSPDCYAESTVLPGRGANEYPWEEEPGYSLWWGTKGVMYCGTSFRTNPSSQSSRTSRPEHLWVT